MNSKLRIKKLTPNAILPRKGSKYASGYDLFACIDSGSLIIGKDPHLVRTGISIEFPNSFDAQIRPRSGLSSKGIGVTLGTIDSDYRGELLITMYVFGTRESFTINHGDNGWVTKYGHNESLLVKEGEIVRKGQRIAIYGGTDSSSTGKHLHYAIFYKGKPVNPLENGLKEKPWMKFVQR